jgi:DNA-binding transcriptional LysR family regulator
MVWDDLRVFAVIVEYGSYKRAATALGLTQPTVGRRIQRLEQALGARLFDRESGSPRLTFEGHRVLNEAKSAGVIMDRLTRRADAAKGKAGGECKLELGEGLAAYWVAPFLPSFVETHPHIALKVFTTLDTNTQRDPQFDVRIQYFARAEGDDVGQRLGTMHFLPFASRTYVAMHGMPETLEDLAHHRLIELVRTPSERGNWQNWIPEDVNLDQILFTNSSALVGEAVNNHMGWALLPSYSAAVRTDIVPFVNGPKRAAPIYAGYNRISGQKPPVRAMLNWLKTVTFNPVRMPWFAEEFVPPDRNWPGMRASVLTPPNAVARVASAEA